jgi:small-conductance mechanosensitive channel
MKNRIATLSVLLGLLLMPLWVTAQSTPPAAESAANTEQAAPLTGESSQDTKTEKVQMQKAMTSAWLRLLDDNKARDVREASVLSFAPHVMDDLARVFNKDDGNKGRVGLLYVLLISLLSIALGLLAGLGIKRLVRSKMIGMVLDLRSTGLNSQLTKGLLAKIPALAGILVVAVVSMVIFLIFDLKTSTDGRMMFQVILGSVLAVMLISTICTFLFSPKDKELRVLSMDDNLAKALSRSCNITLSMLSCGMLIIRYVVEIGPQPQTIAWAAMILGSLVMFVLALLVLSMKKIVTGYMQTTYQDQQGSLSYKLARYWHIPTLVYLAVVWIVWMGQTIAMTASGSGEFIISVLLIPIYLILSHYGKVVISSVIDSLGIGEQKKVDIITGIAEEVDEQEVAEHKKEMAKKVHFYFRLLLIAALTTWVLSIWGYTIPFAHEAMRAIFESLITLSLAITAWRLTSTYIQRKMEEYEPEPTKENEEDVDDEFGGATQRGRGHTLLPMLRKVLGTVLVVMVVLTILSSLGLNIGPLLAGAGVLGLAVGFGARKLVSDILCGFFFLLDDAFRVGEYIQTGSIRGTVETITLRNVMLRHHLGMLQVVPHSDLGAVTNYMRGGIVIKFPLEFPYDTDIEKVRKIIKKVGQAMLEDETLGDDFLQPVKSQGVNQITNSVMVIRVKFTAKPGKQFVIKREAYRRITEALNAKGIYYAHRKVIVDFPEENRRDNLSADQKTKALEAGAAAAASEPVPATGSTPPQTGMG